MKHRPHSTNEIIIVDPDKADYDALFKEHQFDDVQFKFLSAGEQAVRAYPVQALGLWFINLRLPDMPGTALVELLRHRRRDARLCLVGNTYCEADERAARSAGATAYLCKPVSDSWLTYRCVAKPAAPIALAKQRQHFTSVMRPP